MIRGWLDARIRYAPRYTPLSVRQGGVAKKVGWEVQGLREKAALVLAPWLGGTRLH